MGNTEPRPYSRTLANAGISCVVVTNTLTQLGLGTKVTLCQSQRYCQDGPGVMGGLGQDLGLWVCGMAGLPSGEWVMSRDTVAASSLKLPDLGVE